MDPEKTTQLFAELRGQQMRVPNLSPLFSRLRSGINPHYSTIVPFVNEILNRVASKKSHLNAARASDFALFAASCAPDVDLTRLKFLVTYSVFLFFWDDAVDRPDGSDIPELASDLSKASEYRSKSLEFVRYHLGVGDFTEEPVAPTPGASIFAGAGRIIQASGDADVCRRLYEQIKFFMASCEIEQATRLAGKSPSINEFWDSRYGTSSVFTFCSFATYLSNTHIPAEILDSQEAKSLWYATNRNIIIENDILSLKKEVADGAVVTLIPVTMAGTGQTLEESVNDVVRQLDQSFDLIDEASSNLRRKAEGYGPAVLSDVEKFIGVFETIVTGCFNWSLVTARYGVPKDIQADGSLIINL